MSNRPTGSIPNEPGRPDPMGGDGFAVAFRASYRVFWLIAMSVVRDAGLAEDVVQEAAVIALRKLDQYTSGTNFDAWMGTIVRNLALNQARKEKRGRTLSLFPTPTQKDYRPNIPNRTLDGPPHLQNDPGLEFRERPLTGDVEPLLRQWLDDVGDVPRACLILRTLEGLNYGEISRLLQIPEGTAMSHVHRTRRFLRDRLSAAMSDVPTKEPAE